MHLISLSLHSRASRVVSGAALSASMMTPVVQANYPARRQLQTKWVVLNDWLPSPSDHYHPHHHSWNSWKKWKKWVYRFSYHFMGLQLQKRREQRLFHVGWYIFSCLWRCALLYDNNHPSYVIYCVISNASSCYKRKKRGNCYHCQFCFWKKFGGLFQKNNVTYYFVRRGHVK